MMTASIFNRKRPRLSSSTQLSTNSSTPNSGSEYLRKKQQQYSTITVPISQGSTIEPFSQDIINLDSDADDYAFKNLDDDEDDDDDDEYEVQEYEEEDYFDFEDDDDQGQLVQFSSGSMFSESTTSDRLSIANLRLTASNHASPSNSNLRTRYKNKKRTKTLPQLSYSRLAYEPTFDKNSVYEKIGDVKTALIQHQLTNYTYGYSNYSINGANGGNNNRKFSFNTDLPDVSLTKYQQSSSSESFDSSNTCASSIEDVPCDDKDGHYIINPGSFFANDRFQIDSLLGQGTFGKVVKAYDRYNNCVVAIKIIRAIPKYRDASKIELRVLSMLKKHDPENINQCIHLRECFDFRNHICIVTDILKISLYDFLDNCQFLPFPGSHIQAIARQLLRSVAFMHDLNLIHTDLKPENILLKDDSYTKKPYKKFDTNDTTVFQRKILNDPKIYTIDYGSAIFDDEYHSTVVSTRHYRAPEIILGIGWSFPCDLWSIGCILVELITGDALFKTHENTQHLAMMEQVIGQSIDLKLVKKCLNQYYQQQQPANSRRRLSNSNSNSNSSDCIANSFSKATGKLLFPTNKTPITLINEVEDLCNLDTLIGKKTGFKFDLKLSLKDSLIKFKVPKKQIDDYEFWYWFIDLVRNLLVYDPEKRLSAKEALEHRWFGHGIFDDGTTSN